MDVHIIQQKTMCFQCALALVMGSFEDSFSTYLISRIGWSIIES